jgi:hypothetical protein
MNVNRVYNVIRNKEIKHIYAYLHSQNEDGSFNVCFNLNAIEPSPKHLHRYGKSYLDEFYILTGETIKWSLG